MPARALPSEDSTRGLCGIGGKNNVSKDRPMTLQPDGSKNKNGRMAQIFNDLHSADDMVHRTAYDSLMELGGDAVPEVIEAFPQSDGRARLSLIKALGELGDARAVALLVDLMRNRD